MLLDERQRFMLATMRNNNEHRIPQGTPQWHIEHWTIDGWCRTALPLSVGLGFGFLLASLAGSTIRIGVAVLLGAVDGPWPQWIPNLANALQIVAPLTWLLGWLFARTWSYRHGGG